MYNLGNAGWGVWKRPGSLKDLDSNISKKGHSGLRILCLGAHSDDIEIGCGGTILRLLEEHPNSEVTWVVFAASKSREKEALESANLFLEKAKKKTVMTWAFRDGYFPQSWGGIKDCFEELKQSSPPDLIFTQYRNDLHQDHRVISDLTWNTFRSHLILEYEIVKYDGDLGTPNVFVCLDESIVERKITNILNCFQTQKNKRWFKKEAFLSILTLRGIESNAPEGYAEAFYGRKLVW